MLAEELNFTKAADKLCIAQPPLSRQIKELEDEIGTVLFDRSNKRVKLTEAGKYFKNEVVEILDKLEISKKITREIGNNLSGEYRIAYISSTFSGDISALIHYLSGLYPYVKFRLYEVPTAKQIKALEQGKLDLGIVRAPITSSKLKTKLWFRDSFSFVFSDTIDYVNSVEDLSKLRHETFVFFNKDYAPQYYTTLVEICSTLGFVPKVVHESNNVSSIIQMVSNGLGVSIVPSSVLKNNAFSKVKSIEIENSRFNTDVLIAVPQEANSQITRDVLSFLKVK